jgi:2-polyprenyl-3-methyl-5-hydroxy-6-metoxy-1,4-benzoquinol methylase
MGVDQEEINKRQKEFYQNFDKNFATKIWYSVRNGVLTKFRKSVGVESIVIKQHSEWIGDLKDKKVLDLGCYAGNSLSMHLAKNAGEYIAIDLSEQAIKNLNQRLENFPNAKAKAVDFLSNEFEDNNFDLIYAYAVLHHFKDVDQLIDKLNQKLASGGKIITYDPTSTSFPVKMVRGLYRPFQSDKDWEWPFTKKTILKFQNNFKLLDARGTLGKSKWFFILNLLPIAEEKRITIGKAWHEQDWNRSRRSQKHLFRCMHLTMLLEKK